MYKTRDYYKDYKKYKSKLKKLRHGGSGNISPDRKILLEKFSNDLSSRERLRTLNSANTVSVNINTLTGTSVNNLPITSSLGRPTISDLVSQWGQDYRSQPHRAEPYILEIFLFGEEESLPASTPLEDGTDYYLLEPEPREQVVFNVTRFPQNHTSSVTIDMLVDQQYNDKTVDDLINKWLIYNTPLTNNEVVINNQEGIIELDTPLERDKIYAVTDRNIL